MNISQTDSRRTVEPQHRGALLIALPLMVTAVVAIFVAGASSVHAQQTGIEISSLDCTSDPEVMTLTNSGSAPVDLSGWRLESDPVSSESFDLSQVGQVATNSSVNIVSGPGASGSFVWSSDEVLRDGDATDFARVVDDAGSTVAEEACPGPSPTATAPPDGVPNGGGPPGTSSGPATVFMLAGAGLSAAALVVVTLAAWPIGRVLSRFPGGIFRLNRAEKLDDAVRASSAGEAVARGRYALWLAFAVAAVVLILALTFSTRRS